MGLVFTNVVSNGLAIFTQYGKLLLLLVGTMLFMALVINPSSSSSICAAIPIRWCSAACVKAPDGVLHPLFRSEHPREHGDVRKARLGQGLLLRLYPPRRDDQHGRAAITITIMTLAAANTLGMQVSLPAAILLSIMSALGACGASGVAGGSLLLIPMACSLFGISNDIAMQVVASASSSASFRTLSRPRSTLRATSSSPRRPSITSAQAGQAPAGIPRRQEEVKRQNVKTNKSAPAQRAGALFVR